MAVLSDGGWHRLAVSVSSGRLALYVDCSMVESVDWAYKDGLGISTDGLVMVGGIIEGFETPFEVSMQTYKDLVPITYCVMRIIYSSSHQLSAHDTYSKYISKCSQSAFKPKVRFMEDEYFSVFRSYYTPSTSAFILIQVSRRI